MATAEPNGDSESAALGLIDISIVYAKPEAIWCRNLQIADGTTVRDALTDSGFFDQFPDCSIETIRVGIYGQLCALERTLAHGDRVELYRPLVFDPMESRRRRARHRQRTR